MLGGVINKKQRFIYSETALETLRQIHFNTAFIGGSRIRDDGVYTPSMADSKIVETAASRANQVVLVAEKYKFTNQSSSPYMSVPLNQIDVLITDTPLPEELKHHFNPKTQIIPVLKE